MAGLDEVYSQLVPLEGGRLIVPRTAVIEVMGWNTPKQPVADAPAWLLGLLEWQGNRIPLISFEAACGNAVPSAKNRTRIAVLQAIGGVLEPPAFAVATQGYPYLLRVNSNVMRPDEDAGGMQGPVLARVRMANERPMIPDLEGLEAMIAEALGIQAPVPAAPVAEFDPDEMTGAGGIVIDDDIELGGDDLLEDTQPDPTAAVVEVPRDPDELTGLDDTRPSLDDAGSDELAADEDLVMPEVAGLEVEESVATDEPATGYEIDLDDLKLDDDPA